ncbi:MAG: hypothetical protein GF313_04110 [Caldithrix sp.]|nr:hypothetical protein [Caldithrix sp.]
MDNDVLLNLLQKNDDRLQPMMDDPQKYELQIRYTQINRDNLNRPSFKTYTYAANRDAYFYPASTVKLYAALLALEKINHLDINGLSKYTPVEFDSAFSGQSSLKTDSTAKNNRPSIAHFIKQIFLVSDNEAFNRLYEFLGQKKFNERLKAKGYTDTRILHRLSAALTPEENRYTNPLQFIKNGKIIFRQPMLHNGQILKNKENDVLKGRGYMEDGQLIEQSMDFTYKNVTSTKDLQTALMAVFFPKAIESQHTFNLKTDDIVFLQKYMGMLPSESNLSQYHTEDYYDAYVKFFMFGDSKKNMPKHIRIYNKVGVAYGYLIDNAYIVDFKNKIEFLLTAVIHVNANRIFNDNQYEYDSVGFPFLASLGRIIYEYEKERSRPHPPDLSALQQNMEL